MLCPMCLWPPILVQALVPFAGHTCSEVISEAGLLCKQEESNEEEADYGDTHLGMVTLAWLW